MADELNGVVGAVPDQVVTSLLGRAYPLISAIGWAVVVYFTFLIFLAVMKFFRNRKEVRLLKEISSTLKDIKNELRKTHRK